MGLSTLYHYCIAGITANQAPDRSGRLALSGLMATRPGIRGLTSPLINGIIIKKLKFLKPAFLVRAVMAMLWRNYLFGIKYLLSAGLLLLLLKLINWQEALSVIKQLNPALVVLGVFMVFLVESLNAWKVIRIAGSPVLSFKQNLKINFMKTFFLNVLPGGASGELVRVFYLGKAVASHSLSLVTVLIDRITGLWVQSAMAVVAMAVLAGSQWAGGSTLVIGLLVIGAAAVLSVIFFSAFLNLLEKILGKLSGRFREKGGLGEAAKKRFHNILSDKPKLFKILGIGLVYQCIINLNVMLLVYASGHSLNFFEVTVIMFTNVLMVTLPLSIGGWGVQEAVFALFFKKFGLSPETGVVVALLIRTVTIPSSFLGWAVFLKEGVPLKKILQETRVKTPV